MNQADPTEKVSDISWEVPPVWPKYDWPVIASQLRSKPGEWAKIFEDGRTSVVNAIRQGKVMDLHPDLGFEVKTTRNTRGAPRTCSLYMRFNPHKTDDLASILSAAKKEK